MVPLAKVYITLIASFPWIAPLALSASIELVSSSARVTSVKFQKPLLVSEWETSEPIDRTPETPGSYKNRNQTWFTTIHGYIFLGLLLCWRLQGQRTAESDCSSHPVYERTQQVNEGKSSNHVWFAHQAGNWTEENESTVERRDGLSGWKRSLEHSIYLLVAGSQADQRGGVSTYRLQGVASHNHWFVIKSSSCLKISLSSFILRYI